MSATIRLLPSLPLLLACTPPWPALEGCPDTAGCMTEAASTGGSSNPTTNASDAIQTVTGDGSDTSSTSGSTTDDTTTFEPVEPPAIVTVELDPTPIKFNGPIAVTVTAEHAEGVRMLLDTGDEVELETSEPGVFGGEIVVYTGLLNGPHVALLTPWHETLDGETVEAPYEIALPKPGSQNFWETGDLIGAGQVVAMGVLPGGEVVELGTHSPNGSSRCYLRRRDKGGAWGPDDVVQLLPDVDCAAIDLAVNEGGEMFALVNRQGGDGLRWWLAKIPAWGVPADSIGIGAKDDTAAAVAVHPSGTVAVCGHAPNLALDDDAMAWIFRPNLPGETRKFDYLAEQKLPNSFSERVRDCAFTGDGLALVGEANGLHGQEKDARDRLFILRVNAKTEAEGWIVAPSDTKTQSGAQAVAVDSLGRLFIAGYTCDDICQPEGELRLYDTERDLAWRASLGLFPTKQFGVQDLAWSPAGYAVVATGGMKGDEAAFTVRAFEPLKIEPRWTFAQKDGQVLHMALALAIGHYGEVYAGGLGANGYPAVAYIAG